MRTTALTHNGMGGALTPTFCVDMVELPAARLKSVLVEPDTGGNELKFRERDSS
jgi:hypothetical protein